MSDFLRLVLAFWPVPAVIAGLVFAQARRRHRRELLMKHEARMRLEGQYRKSGYTSAHGSAFRAT